MSLTPIQKLDITLKMFAPKFDGSIKSYSYKDIQEISKVDMNNYLNPHEIERILEKLTEDKYIALDKVRMFTEKIPFAPDEIMFHYYFLTFNGETFIKEGGYKKSIEIIQYEKKIQNLKDWALIVGTWFAGFAALLLVSWEIYKHYCLHID